MFIQTILAALLMFFSPCVLPMLPVFVTYFSAGESNWRRTLLNVLGFVLGFAIIFMLIGLAASGLSIGLSRANVDDWVLNLIIGVIVIVLGFSFIGFIKIPFLNTTLNVKVKTENMRFFSAVIFGVVYAFSFGACALGVQAMLIGDIMNKVVETGNMFDGVMVQLVFTLVLGLLFVLSALLIDFLKGFFSFVKRHYKIINLISGSLLIAMGILMATGMMAKISVILTPVNAAGVENLLNVLRFTRLR